MLQEYSKFSGKGNIILTVKDGLFLMIIAVKICQGLSIYCYRYPHRSYMQYTNAFCSWPSVILYIRFHKYLRQTLSTYDDDWHILSFVFIVMQNVQ